MMKLNAFLSALLLFCISASSQSCWPDGLWISNQEQIDSLHSNYPNCTEVEGTLIINCSGTNITNLNGLGVLTSIGGDLVIRHNYSLESLTGLHNIKTVAGDLIIEYNEILSHSFEGLEKLSTVMGSVTINNNYIYNLNGLDSLSFIGQSLEIYSNQVLTSIEAFEKITNIAGNLEFRSNAMLENLKGMDKITTVDGNLFIWFNTKLSSLNELQNLTTVGEDMEIRFANSLVNLSGLQNLSSIGGKLTIRGNMNLSSLYGLQGLLSTGAGLEIIQNAKLVDLSHLDNLNSIDGSLSIGGILDHSNPLLISLDGLENIDPLSITEIIIKYNPQLTKCDVQSICDFISSSSPFHMDIGSNAPGCNSHEEVQDSCESNFGLIDKINESDKINIFPNPANQELNISVEGYAIDKIIIYTLTGQQFLQERPSSGTIDISALPPGMYIVEVMVENRKVRQKLLIE